MGLKDRKARVQDSEISSDMLQSLPRVLAASPLTLKVALLTLIRLSQRYFLCFVNMALNRADEATSKGVAAKDTV